MRARQSGQSVSKKRRRVVWPARSEVEMEEPSARVTVKEGHGSPGSRELTGSSGSVTHEENSIAIRSDNRGKMGQGDVSGFMWAKLNYFLEHSDI